MSFWKSLFGGRTESAETPGESVEYNGFTICAAPYKEGDRYQTTGTIAKEIAGVRKEHRFVRADSHASLETATEFSLVKARQIVDQLGDRLFE